jgi:IS6 family transposase
VAETDLFKWRHYESEIILLCVRWYLRYALSYRDLEEMMRERGLSLVHTTIYRWVQAFAPELEKRIRPHLKPTNDSYRVDETYIKVKGVWKYLYRAVDSTGQTIDFLISAKRDARVAKRFFRKMLKLPQHQSPRVINVDQNRSYPPAIEELKEEGVLSIAAQLHRCKYLNNIVEQDHRFIKRRVNPGLVSFAKTHPTCIFNHFLRPPAVRSDDATLQLRRSQSPVRTPAPASLSAPAHPYTRINVFWNRGSKRSNFSKFDVDDFRRERLHGPDTRGGWNRSVSPRMRSARDSAPP